MPCESGVCIIIMWVTEWPRETNYLLKTPRGRSQPESRLKYTADLASQPPYQTQKASSLGAQARSPGPEFGGTAAKTADYTSFAPLHPLTTSEALPIGLSLDLFALASFLERTWTLILWVRKNDLRSGTQTTTLVCHWLPSQRKGPFVTSSSQTCCQDI